MMLFKLYIFGHGFNCDLGVQLSCYGSQGHQVKVCLDYSHGMGELTLTAICEMPIDSRHNSTPVEQTCLTLKVKVCSTFAFSVW